MPRSQAYQPTFPGPWWRFQPGQLVIVDEASLAATLDLDRIAACAAEAGAKLLLVGDWAQLSSVDAGGAFGLLVRDRGTGAPELGAARRFAHEWERDASTRLRVGDPASLDDYTGHDRIHEGDQADMVDAAWRAWAGDERAGKQSLMIAGDKETVRALNERARAERVAAGHVDPSGLVLRDGLTAAVGDRIVTRRNDRRLGAGNRWVKNGDSWTVTAVTPDGRLEVRRPSGGPTVLLPAGYAAEHVELGYATTAHRAQGATVDTAHAVVARPGASREVLYVILTRAREANHVYVATDLDTEPLTGFADEPPTGRGVLLAALGNPGAAVSAHEVADDEHETAASIRTLAAEYETLAHLAQAPRWAAAFAGAGLGPAAVAEIETSPAYGALSTALRRADAHRLPVEAALPRLAAGVSLGSRDPAAVLHARVEAWTAAAVRAGRAAPMDAVAGLLPAVRLDVAGVRGAETGSARIDGDGAPGAPTSEPRCIGDQSSTDSPDRADRPAVGPGATSGRGSTSVPADLAAALHGRHFLMQRRVDDLLARAERADAPWLARLGPRPTNPPTVPAWETARRAVVAYRDRYAVTTADPLGPAVAGDTQRDEARTRCARAITAVQPASLVSNEGARHSGAPSRPARELSTDPGTTPSGGHLAASR